MGLKKGLKLSFIAWNDTLKLNVEFSQLPPAHIKTFMATRNTNIQDDFEKILILNFNVSNLILKLKRGIFEIQLHTSNISCLRDIWKSKRISR